MKIIKRGDTANRPVPWWVGKPITCMCGTVYELEADDYKSSDFCGSVLPDVVAMCCPVCHVANPLERK